MSDLYDIGKLGLPNFTGVWFLNSQVMEIV